MRAGETVDRTEGDVLSREGEPRRRKVAVVVRGAIRVDAAGERLATVGPGDVLGEFAYIGKRGGKEQVTTSCAEATKVVEWSYDALDAHLSEHADARRAIENLFARKLLAKIERMNEHHLHLHEDMSMAHPRRQWMMRRAQKQREDTPPRRRHTAPPRPGEARP